MSMGNKLLSVGIVVVKIGVLFVETDHFVQGVVRINITLFMVVVGRVVGLLHWVIKKLALKSFLALFIIFKLGQSIQIYLPIYLILSFK